MTHTGEIKPNFVLVDPPLQRDPATDALRILSIDTPASDLRSDEMKDFQRVFARQFGEF